MTTTDTKLTRAELQARVDAEMRERAYNEAHYLNDVSVYFPGSPV
jgi:hypothetical protein